MGLTFLSRLRGARGQSSYVQLPKDESNDNMLRDLYMTKTNQSLRLWRYGCLLSLTLNVLSLFAITLGARQGLFLKTGYTANLELPYSPANSIIDYETRDLFHGHNIDLFGPPSPEVDTAWRSQLKGTLIRISEEERALSGLPSIPLADGGYAAGLGVSHNLHCIKRLNQLRYMDYYWPDRTPADEHEILHHASHCLETLRQSVLCNVDFSLYTVQWIDSNRERPAVVYGNNSRCVNWDRLHGWMQDRAASQANLVVPEGWDMPNHWKFLQHD